MNLDCKSICGEKGCGSSCSTCPPKMTPGSLLPPVTVSMPVCSEGKPSAPQKTVDKRPFLIRQGTKGEGPYPGVNAPECRAEGAPAPPEANLDGLRARDHYGEKFPTGNLLSSLGEGWVLSEGGETTSYPSHRHTLFHPT